MAPRNQERDDCVRHNGRFQGTQAGERDPAKYQQVPLLLKFDVKMCLTRKARMCAVGHVTDPPTTDTYSGPTGVLVGRGQRHGSLHE
jgi:hypothetical protein